MEVRDPFMLVLFSILNQRGGYVGIVCYEPVVVTAFPQESP